MHQITLKGWLGNFSNNLKYAPKTLNKKKYYTYQQFSIWLYKIISKRAHKISAIII